MNTFIEMFMGFILAVCFASIPLVWRRGWKWKAVFSWFVWIPTFCFLLGALMIVDLMFGHPGNFGRMFDGIVLLSLLFQSVLFIYMYYHPRLNIKCGMCGGTGYLPDGITEDV